MCAIFSGPETNTEWLNLISCVDVFEIFMMRFYSNEKIIGIPVMIRLGVSSSIQAYRVIYTSRKVHRQRKIHTMSVPLIWLIDKALGRQFPLTDKADISLYRFTHNEVKAEVRTLYYVLYGQQGTYIPQSILYLLVLYPENICIWKMYAFLSKSFNCVLLSRLHFLWQKQTNINILKTDTWKQPVCVELN